VKEHHRSHWYAWGGWTVSSTLFFLPLKGVEPRNHTLILLP
jgi:hypothetical protein